MTRKFESVSIQVKALLFLMVALSLAAGCVTDGNANSSNMTAPTSIRFLADLNLASGSQVLGTTLGGISGLSPSETAGKYLAISDDKGDLNQSRFYTVGISYAKNSGLQWQVESVTSLSQASGVAFPLKFLDPEGIVLAKDGSIYVSSEGNGRAIPRQGPAILHLDRAGKHIGDLPIPAHFTPTPTGTATSGVMDNLAFEGLSATPDQKTLFALCEGPVVQDDSAASFAKGSRNRGLIYQWNEQGEYRLQREFAYDVESAKPFEHGVTGKESNGVSEILAINDHQLIVMERGGMPLEPGGWHTFVRLFLVDTDGATDTQGLTSLKGENIKVAQKKLLLDLDDILPQLSEGYRTLDNLEGLAWGEEQADGSRILYIVSDDNFSREQRLQLLAFSLR